MPTTLALTDRALLALSGPDAEELLQGTLTQDVRLLATQPLLYACHLTPQGKLVSDLFLFRQNKTYYLDVPATYLMPLAQRLHQYCVGLNVTFEDVSADWYLYADPTHTTGWPDPRLLTLPYRTYTPSQHPAQPVEQYHNIRITLGVPEPLADAATNALLPADLGLTHLHAVSFTKGCYVGQEVTTRLHRRGTPKKALYLAEMQAPAPTGTPLTNANGLKVGWLGTANATHTLAVLSIQADPARLFCANHPLPPFTRSPIYPPA